MNTRQNDPVAEGAVPPDGRGGPANADVLLTELNAQLAASIVDLEAARERVRDLQAMRARGASWREIVHQEERPLVVESLSRALDGIGGAGGRFRRAEAVALHAEGETISGIGRLFGVSRQRVSAYLQERP
ncbi:helix-turn-helix domain-containing protein [Pseudonocardia nematodicida]|uniref:Helix-turn-helix domain-containing protein n=1 Tax=Pseudonocardia nematodicida TaxID=1206997 RepID=A0ABV1KDQ3_9PSEU